VSLLAVLREVERVVGRKLPIDFGDWRKGDQLYFVADTSRLRAETGWQARIGWREGLKDLAAWLRSNRPGLSQAEPERIRA
jgi:CDP-paratose 2-epimerase